LVQEVGNSQNGQRALRLVPIDHGLTLPDSFQVSSYDLAWMSYGQAEEPFSERTLDYIKAINIEDDINFIESNFDVRPVCLRNMKISTLLLQQAAQRGLTLAQIGSILCRPDDDDTEPSLLERLVQQAEHEVETEDFSSVNFESRYFTRQNKIKKSSSHSELSPIKMQLQASLGANDCGKVSRCRGLTVEIEDDGAIEQPPRLKRSKRNMHLTVDDQLFTDPEPTCSAISLEKFNFNRDKESPHNDALFYFFLRNLDELLASFSN